MGRSPRLKVYRTAIGFHDAYVAAPNRKAALAAWGSKADLFARGVAEIVDDAELSREPLARPGEVLKRSRGTTAEQLAALPPDRPARPAAKVRATATKPKAGPRPKAPPKPRPSRAPLDTAERALADADARRDAAFADLARREKALARERRSLETERARERDRLERLRDRERERYDRAIARWRS